MNGENANWMGNPETPLTGFTTANQSRDVRLVMWSDVFLHNIKGKKIAIVLFESQGLYKERSGMIDSSDNLKIFALGALISSVQIYNTDGILQNHHFEFLQGATSFAQIIQNKSSNLNSPPFQKLVLLMRNWYSMRTFGFGLEQGEMYIKDVLESENARNKDFMNFSFESYACFLMPFPWKTVNKEDFDNRLVGLCPDLVKNLKIFIEWLFSDENLLTRSVNGIEETGKSYHDYIENQLKIFQALLKQSPSEIMKQIFNGHRESASNLYEEVKIKYLQEGLSVQESHKIAKQEAEKYLKSFDLIPSIQNKYFEDSKRELNYDLSNRERSITHGETSILYFSTALSLSFVLVLFIFTFVLLFLILKRCRVKRVRNQDLELADIDDHIWQIERDRIDQMYSVGSGNFGEVFKGILLPKQQEPRENEVVAIKNLKFEKFPGMTEKEFISKKLELERKFIEEARRMTKFDSFHIMKLKGYWLRDKPYLIVVEYAEHGDLRTFLMQRRDEFQEPEIKSTAPRTYITVPEMKKLLEPRITKLRPLHHMMLEIADGMAYLEKMKFVHRDLAARNCLVTSNFIVKIGDFGLSRFTDSSNYYTPLLQREVPLRWLSPENITKEKFSSKSDVFSFGILMWEIVTMGETPYPVSGENLAERDCQQILSRYINLKDVTTPNQITFFTQSFPAAY